MPVKYELIYYYHHCMETNIYPSGTVDNEVKAKEWVLRMERSKNVISDTDSNCDCMADYCPIKHSKPVYSYRKVEEKP